MLITSAILFNIKPTTFPSYWDTFYWSAITLTTVGYGNIYPTTTMGQALGLISAFIGVKIIALPTGIFAGNILAKLKDTSIDKN